MKRLLVVSAITLGLSFPLGAYEHTQDPAAQAGGGTTTPGTTSKPRRKRTRRTAHRPTPRKNTNADDTVWATFRSAAGRFSVLIPGTPTDKIETVESEHGPYTSHWMVLRDTKNVFIIGWVDYQPSFDFNRETEMELNRDNFVSGVKAKLLNSRVLKIDGYHALEFQAENAEKIFTSRVYMVGRRPYQIVIGSPRGEDNSLAVDRFFNSFKVSLK